MNSFYINILVVLLYPDISNFTFWNVKISKCKIFLINFLDELGNFKQKKIYTSQCKIFLHFKATDPFFVIKPFRINVVDSMPHIALKKVQLENFKNIDFFSPSFLNFFITPLWSVLSTLEATPFLVKDIFTNFCFAFFGWF